MNYKKGCHVRHKIFGHGIVLDVLEDTIRVQFDVLETPRTIVKQNHGVMEVI